MAVIMALDLATNIGWCVGEPGSTPRAGSYRLPSTGDDVGRFLDHFSDWLVYTLGETKPTDVFYESPFVGAKTARKTAMKLMSLCGHTELIATRRRLPCSEATGSEVTKYFIGRARFQHDNPTVRRQMKKDAVIGKCRKLGWQVPDDDAADAAALWTFAEHLLCPGLREIGDLFDPGAAA